MMVILIFSQDEMEIEFACFETNEEAREFLRTIPGYEYREEESDGIKYEYDTIDPKKLSDYMEMEYKGNIIPLSRFSFDENTLIDVYLKSIPNLSRPDQGFIEDYTRLDAYYIDNRELKSYVTRREENYQAVKKALEEKGYEVERSFFGSEDGEAVVYKGKGDKDFRFLTHMDPAFVEDFDLGDILSDLDL